MAKKFDVTNHILIPKHAKVSEREKKDIFSKYNITFKELPKISVNDPAIKHLKLSSGDIVKIVRESKTAGEAVYYRGVTNV